MKAATYKKKIIQDMKSIGTYQPEFDKVIDNLADIYEDMDTAREQFKKSGGNIVRDCASWLTKTVGSGRSTYRFSIPQNYLSENGINYPGVGGDNKPMRNISFTIQVGGKLYVVCEGSVAVFDMAALGLE